MSKVSRQAARLQQFVRDNSIIDKDGNACITTALLDKYMKEHHAPWYSSDEFNEMVRNTPDLS